MKTYLFAYLGSAFLALVTTPLVIRLARRLKATDHPSVRKVHKKPVPRIGGVAIFLSMMCLTIGVLFLSNVIGDTFRDIPPGVIALLCAATFVFLVGLIDDIRGLSGKIKLLSLIIASLVICASGSRIDSLSIGTILTLKFPLLSWPLTVLWIAGITVGINFIDGLDGLAAGISAIACGVIAFLAVHFGQPFIAVLMVALLGCLTGFLFFNFNPAKIFMGDCGSMFLGFTIGTSTVMCTSKSSSIVVLALPAIALGIPIIDSACTMIRRGILERRSIFKAERGHIHHRLLDLGLHHRHVVIILYVVTLTATALGSFMLITPDVAAFIVFFCVFVLLLLLFRIIGSVQLHQIVGAIRRDWVIRKESKRYKDCFEDMQLQFRVAISADDWWHAVCTAAQRMNCVWLSLKFTNEDGIICTSVWRRPNFEPDFSRTVITTIPVPQRQSNRPLELEIAIPADSSLESAGHRVALLSRLIDEHHIVDLPRNGKPTLSGQTGQSTTNL